MRTRAVFVFATAVLLTTLVAPAAAQDTSRGEVTGGWRVHHATFGTVPVMSELPRPNDFPSGWYADVAANLSPKFALVGEVGGTTLKDETSRSVGFTTISESIDVSMYTFLGGLRIRAPQARAIVPFGQVLFGGARHDNSAERTVQFATSSSVIPRQVKHTGPVLALDAGVTLMAGPIAVRASAGYARFFKLADADALRVNVGLGLRF